LRDRQPSPACISAVQILITDSGISDKDRQEFEDAGVRVEAVPATEAPPLEPEPIA
jgi:hypothetical protein